LDARASQPGPVIVLESDSVVVASWNDVCFEAWLTRGTDRDIRAATDAHVRVLARTSGSIIPCSIVHEQAAGPIDSEVRAALVERGRQLDPRTKASALVILAGGFAGAVVRGIATGLSLLTRAKHPTKTFASIDAASRWLEPYFAPVGARAPTADDFVRAFAQLPTRRPQSEVG
jgi:hypothetical protein